MRLSARLLLLALLLSGCNHHDQTKAKGYPTRPSITIGSIKVWPHLSYLRADIILLNQAAAAHWFRFIAVFRPGPRFDVNWFIPGKKIKFLANDCDISQLYRWDGNNNAWLIAGSKLEIPMGVHVLYHQYFSNDCWHQNSIWRIVNFHTSNVAWVLRQLR